MGSTINGAFPDNNGWKGSYRKVFGTGDPSINHIFAFKTAASTVLTQIASTSTDDDADEVTSSVGVGSAFYVLFFGVAGYEYTSADMVAVFNAITSKC